MTKDKIASGTNTEFEYQADTSILIVRFHGFQRPEEAAKDNTLLTETIREKRIRLLLINQRNIKVLSAAMQSFIVNSATRVVTSGVKKLAVVVPEDVFALAAMSKIHSEFKFTGIAIQLFSSEDQAMGWLSLQPSIL